MADFALALEGVPDEAVEVNQRALIDKVLARYSGENTVFRELLQNADDASASSVEIKFLSNAATTSNSTQPASQPITPSSSSASSSSTLPDLTTHKISRVLVRNNGIPFRGQDWARLRKIAEGNPDESKIGAFGVGFYALWSICDSPIVLSGPSIMGFNWSTKNPDQLVTRRGINPSPSEWTSFIMDVRSPSPMPPPFEFSRFLATSLAFTTQIRSVSLYFDDHLMCKLNKKLAPPQILSTPSNITLSTSSSMMKIQSVEQTSVQIDTDILKWTLQYSKPKSKLAIKNAAVAAATSTSSFASRMLSAFTKTPSSVPTPTTNPSTPKDSSSEPSSQLSTLKASVFLRVVTGNINVSIPSAFRAELERATKKPPPKKTQYALIWTNKDEFDAGKDLSSSKSGLSKLLSGDETARAVFDGLISDLDVQGRVFIGFPTHQTTGFSGSVAARFIPTVERESLDLQAKYVADWNKELLAIGGILARVVYEGELKEIEGLWKNTDDESKRSQLTLRGLHAMQFFSFYASTPAGAVSFESEESFFRCDRQRSLTVPSSLGPMSANQVRLPNAELSGFIKNVPLLPNEISKDGHLLISKLRDRRMISEITLEDVFKELENRVLSVDEMRECLNWWISLTGIQGYDRSLLKRFHRCAVFKYQAADSTQHASKEQPDTIMSLSEASTFINIKLIPTDVPLPAHCLPFCLTKSINADALKRVFGFRELNILEFTTHLFSPEMKGTDRITESPPLAEQLLNILCKAWTSLTNDQRAEIVTYLSDKAFVPTRHGMRKPSDAYHSNITLFKDLAVVLLPSGTPVKGTMTKVLSDIGVRKHVELQMVFSRLLGSGEWNHADLVKYLVSVRDTLTDFEVDKLRQTNWLPKEGEPKVVPPPGPDGKAREPKTIRYSASQLYEPSVANQELQLPLVEWPGKWRSTSEEAKLLFFLGLNKMPSIEALLNLAANPKDAQLREKALQFFLEHFGDYRAAYRPSPDMPAFVPCESGLFKPGDAYSNPEAAVMGFNVLQNKYLSDYQKFGLKQNPDPQELLDRLLKQTPPDPKKAKTVFEYLSTRVADFSQSQLQTLKQAQFVPISGKEVTHVAPGGCFFQSTDSANQGPFKSLFTYIDFGPSARPFLLACGVKNEPTVQEIAQMLIADPAKFYALAGSAEEYLQVLRNIAANFHLLGHGLRRAMQRSAFILGSRRVASSSGSSLVAKPQTFTDEDEEIEAGQPFVHVLALPGDVVIIDDSHSYSQFTTVIIACPQEAVFEQLAEALGAPRLTQLVKESFQIQRSAPERTERSEEIRRLLVERTALFLHERQTGARDDVIRDAEWLKRHLTVKSVEQVSLQRQLVYLGKPHSSVLEATAAASMEGRNSMVLYLVRKGEIDWFELASSICKLILAHQKLSDSLFFMTILQTSLKNLKRRGVNVDRIINARKAERDAALQRAREEKLQRQLDDANALTPEQLESHARGLEERFPDADPGFIRKALSAEKEDHRKRVEEKFAHGAYERRPVVSPPLPPPKMPEISQRQSGIFSALRRKLLNENSSNDPPPYSPLSAAPSAPIPSPIASQSISQQSQVAKPPAIKPPVQITPMSDIRSNLLKAINVSKPDTSADIRTLPDTKPVKESEASYCDPKGSREDLTFLSTISGLRFYVSRSIDQHNLNGELVLFQFGDAIVRYIDRVIKPIGEIFDIDPNSLHIFYDLEGPIIAFNRNGSLFFNLRYYLSWYDEEVKKGNLSNALIGTFSTFAHELAHNLVEAHNSEHEWWMSAFIEQYFLKVSTYIVSNQSGGSSTTQSASLI
ncbi:hypothetical protein PTTG_01164 [Puccinia triticina 1-1 BBBD Race 1]|uniref:Sacsin/Nov domain-containing protein n=1 Tax=Puccinia triticina (isolate 1-1 / race 1 (BBBD)) TaxID=630390 RepID=A0A180GJ87_PUCT1|nr:hypothetical protein PTTG_01164 [Puccinia triticina 1-1 BBBD Race 1]